MEQVRTKNARGFMKKNSYGDGIPRSSGFEKMIYSIGCVGSNFCWAFTASYVTMYFTDCVGLSAAMAGMILMLSRILDGISDVACAWMFKKVRWKSGNRIRPWFLISAPLLGLSMMLLFHVPAMLSVSGKNAYAFVMYAFMAAGAYTIFCLAQSSIVTVISYDPADRARVTAWGFAILNLSGILINILTPMILLAGGGAQYQGGWHIVSSIYAIITTVFIFLMGLFLKEKSAPEGYGDSGQEDGKNAGFKTVIVYLLKEKWTWIILLMHLFGWFLQGIQGIEAYFYRDVLGNLQLQSSLGNVYVISVVIGILLGPVIAKKIGRNRINIIGVLISAIGCFGYFFFASLDTVPLFVICLVMKGIGYGPFLGSAFVYSSDLADYMGRKYRVSAPEMASMTSSVGIKIGMGIGAGIIGFILTLVGYDAAMTVQTANVQNGIHTAFALLPLISNIGLLICLLLWKLDRTVKAK